MSTQPQPQPNAQNALVNSIVNAFINAVKDAAPGIIAGLFNSIFHKKPKQIPVPPPDAPEPTPGVPVPIPTPSQSTPNPAVPSPARRIARVVLRLRQAERPDMTTPERLQDPGNLYDNPMGMVANGEAFNYGTAAWFDQTAYDENGDEWQGNSILAADLDYRTRHEIRQGGSVIAFIQGEGGEGEGQPHDWKQQNANEISWAQRSWKDSLGMNARVRMGAEGTFEVQSWFNGVASNTLIVRIS